MKAFWRKRSEQPADTSEWDQIDWISHENDVRRTRELERLRRLSVEYWLMKAGFAAAIAHLLWDVTTDILRWCGIIDV